VLALGYVYDNVSKVFSKKIPVERLTLGLGSPRDRMFFFPPSVETSAKYTQGNSWGGFFI